MYTTYEAGKRRLVNHMRARARSPRRAVGVGVARPDMTCRCDVLRLENVLLLKALKTETIKCWH